MSDSNVETGESWDRRAAVWERRADSLASLPDAYGTPTIDALDPTSGERVMDIGCGPGVTAMALAARVGPAGHVLGVDIAPAMIEAARRRAAKQGVTNVSFEVADAQTASFGAPFDAAFSRFGVMFFADPVAAFANIGRALHSGGRLACVVWGPLADNPWMLLPTVAAASVLGVDLAVPEAGAPGPFSFGDPERLRSVVTAGGFVDASVDPIAGVRIFTAATADEDIEALLDVGPASAAFHAADEPTRQATIDAGRMAVEPFRDDQTWRVPGAAWMVTARRP